MESIEEIISQFDIPGRLEKITPVKGGRIHLTYLAEWDVDGEKVSTFLQKINSNVYQDIESLNHNLQVVMEAFYSSPYKDEIEIPVTIPTKKGTTLVCDSGKNYWRLTRAISDGYSFTLIDHLPMAKEAGRLVGKFLKVLASIPTDRLSIPINDFHNFDFYEQRLENALTKDVSKRKKETKNHINQLRALKDHLNELIIAFRDQKFPVRVVHNDMKLSNILFSEKGDRAMAVIDLDTCMPGTSLFDIGDMIRSSCFKGTLQRGFEFIPAHYNDLTNGYLEIAGDILSDEEVYYIPMSGAYFSFELSTRYLLDYLEGDQYFVTYSDKENLLKCETELAKADHMVKLLPLLMDA